MHTKEEIMQSVNRSVEDLSRLLDDMETVEAPSGFFEKVVSEDELKLGAESMRKAGYDINLTAMEAMDAYAKGYNLFLSGTYGSGKTFFFECLNKVRSEDKRIAILPMRQTSMMTPDEIREWLTVNAYREVVLDDIGTESEFNYYGTKLELFPYLLDKRLGCSARTHVTSNMSAKDIISRYKQRVADRLTMFKIVKFSGKSRRHPMAKNK